MTLTVVREAQPGGRDPAPGELALVQAFANTFWDAETHDEMLTDPAALADWLAAHGLVKRGVRASARDLERALEIRAGIQALLFANNGHPRPVGELSAPVTVALGGEGPQLRGSSDSVEGALGRLLGIAAVAMLDGSWQRLKACPGRHCGWAFYDHSRNQAGTWCSMRVCGGREKARAYYKRSRGA